MRSLLVATAVFLMALIWTGCSNAEKNHHADHSGHSHSEESEHADEHGHHDHDSEEGEHSGHDDEGVITVAPEDMKMAEITTARVETGTISTSLDLSGEIGFNEDRVVHITPRFAGIVKEARYRIGEYVKANETVALIESNESMTTYSLKAPISGRIIEKHAAAGEHVSEEESLYLLADLSTVWVNLAVYPKDADRIKQGQNATITAVGSTNSITGTFSYVTPVMDAQTRKITARIVLPNVNNAWRPGTFVNAYVEAGEGEPGLVVDRNAVQILDNESVVFIQHEAGRFKAVPVKTGDKNSRKIKILAGLEEGQEYVNNGAFELKAKVVTSSLGAHAGHGH
ncbi:MAG: efflux RND transporter periplasmic adaptor subunit [Fibrobacter sp.]|nr:efflux RND transporter periplasmic adaptor subunit [Fibrobacter sp.]